jgi:hypothetical protein
VRDQADGSQDGVVTDKGNVPNRMKQIPVDCGLHDIEHAHCNERGIVAHTVSLEAALVFFRFG